MQLISSIKEEIILGFKRNSLSYLKIGQEEYKESKRYIEKVFQPAIGNLCISIEFMLKYIVAKEIFPFLYRGLPDDMQMMINFPDKFNKSERYFASDLKNFKNKTIKFDKAVGYFYKLFPKQKNKFKPYLSEISHIRNKSVHALLPNFQQFDLERVLYISLLLYKFFLDEGYYTSDSKIKTDFIKEYNNKKVSRVKKAIEKAKRNTKQIKDSDKKIELNGWDELITECPVCQSQAKLFGYTNLDCDSSGCALTFYAEEFKCEKCDLKLNDYKELDFAGIKTIYNRNESLNSWFKDKI